MHCWAALQYDENGLLLRGRRAILDSQTRQPHPKSPDLAELENTQSYELGENAPLRSSTRSNNHLKISVMLLL